jgi:hypothetical protein
MTEMRGLLKPLLPIRVPLFLAALCWLAPAAAQGVVDSALDAAGVPKVAAFLPSQYDVARTAPLPIDGVWRVNTIGKKIRIEQGRAYALDPWRHLFVLQVSPGMVVMQDFQRTGVGVYAANDLPLLGPATLTLNREGNLDVSVQGQLGPARYQLIRLDAQYPDALSQELSAMHGASAPPVAPPAFTPPPAPAVMPAAPAPGASIPGQPLPGMPTAPPAPMPAPAPVWTPPAPAPAPQAPPLQTPENCTPIGIDPDTGLPICA